MASARQKKKQERKNLIRALDRLSEQERQQIGLTGRFSSYTLDQLRAKRQEHINLPTFQQQTLSVSTKADFVVEEQTKVDVDDLTDIESKYRYYLLLDEYNDYVKKGLIKEISTYDKYEQAEEYWDSLSEDERKQIMLDAVSRAKVKAEQASKEVGRGRTFQMHEV